MLPAAILIIAALGDPLEFEVTSHLGELDDAVRQQVSTRVETVAASLEHHPADAAEHKLTIRVEWTEGSETDFLVTLRSSLGEDAAEVESFECRECNATQLLDRTEAHARTAIERLFESAEVEVQDIPTPTAPPPVETSPASPARKKLGHLEWAGIGLLGVSVSSVAAGSVFLAVGETRPKSDPTSLRDFRPAGYAVLGVGGAAFVTGTVLLILDSRATRSGSDVAALRIMPTGSGVRMLF